MIRFIKIASFTTILASVATQVQAQNAMSATYDQWTVRCVTREEGENKTKVKGCSLDSTAVLKLQSGQTAPVLGMTLQWSDAKSPKRFHINVKPLGFIQSGVQVLDKDKKELLSLKYEICRPDWCETVTDIDDAKIQALKKAGETVTISYRGLTAQGAQDFPFSISMKGFSEAYDVMQKEMKK